MARRPHRGGCALAAWCCAMALHTTSRSAPSLVPLLSPRTARAPSPPPPCSADDGAGREDGFERQVSRWLRLRGGNHGEPDAPLEDAIHAADDEGNVGGSLDDSSLSTALGNNEDDVRGLNISSSFFDENGYIKDDLEPEWSSGRGNPGSDTLWVPDNMTNIPRAIRKCCGVMLRYVEWPAPGPDGLINPPITQFGEPERIESHEWETGNGQKLRLRTGFYSWGAWSERLKRYKHPHNIVVAGWLDMEGVEEGVCLNGAWHFVNGSGTVRHLVLSSRNYLPGIGGGLTLQIDDGAWHFARCRLAVSPGPMTAVMAVAGDARVRAHESIITRTPGVEIGAQGYGMFVWESASVSLDACCVWELKVGADVSFDAHLDMQQCNVSFNRIGIMMHDRSHVTLCNTTMLLNHRAAFEVGMHGRGQAHLRLENVSLRGTRKWIDAWRPKEVIERNVTVDNVNVSLPTVHLDTAYPIIGVPQTHNASLEALVHETDCNLAHVLWNCTSLETLAAMVTDPRERERERERGSRPTSRRAHSGRAHH
eukprot:Tamp_13038.p1 GENE.Tamp_13038~~Tamp_13038.p1  ORF type:complete len:537 (+),score=71.67 Tamp_13038:79-1689(+)